MRLIGKILRFAFSLMSRGPAALQHSNLLIKENANLANFRGYF